VDNELEVIHEHMEETRSSLADKLEALENQVLRPVQAVSDAVTSTAETVQETIETVKHTLDIRHHVKHHPWLSMAGAVATGFVGDRLLLGRSPSTVAAASVANGVAAAMSQNGHSQTNGAKPETKEAGAESEEGGALLKMFHKLQQQAVGTLMGAVKDLVLRAVPDSISKDAAHVVDDFTVRFGGKPLYNGVKPPENSEN